MSAFIDAVLNIEISESRRLEFPLVAALAVSLVSGAAWLVTRRATRNAALRHVVLSAAVFVCLASPATVWLCEAAGLTLVSVPLFEEEQPTAAAIVPARETAPVCVATPLPADEWLTMATVAGESGPAISRPALTVGCCPEPNADAASDVPTATTPIVPDPAPAEPSVADAVVTSSSIRTAVASAMLVWAIGAGVLLARLAVCCWCVVRLRRSSRPAHEEHLLALLRTVSDDVGMRPAPRLLVSKRTVTPQAVGLGRPAIVLPERLLGNIGDDELRDVLTHEAAHLKRGDQHAVILQRMAAALYWPIVTVHALNRELQRSREELCDNAVLAGRDAIDYGRTLLHVAELLVNTRTHAAMVGMLGGRGELERRVAGLIDPNRSTQATVRRTTVLAVTCLFLCGGAIASTTRFTAEADREDDTTQRLFSKGRVRLPPNRTVCRLPLLRSRPLTEMPGGTPLVAGIAQGPCGSAGASPSPTSVLKTTSQTIDLKTDDEPRDASVTEPDDSPTQTDAATAEALINSLSQNAKFERLVRNDPWFTGVGDLAQTGSWNKRLPLAEAQTEAITLLDALVWFTLDRSDLTESGVSNIRSSQGQETRDRHQARRLAVLDHAEAMVRFGLLTPAQAEFVTARSLAREQGRLYQLEHDGVVRELLGLSDQQQQQFGEAHLGEARLPADAAVKAILTPAQLEIWSQLIAGKSLPAGPPDVRPVSDEEASRIRLEEHSAVFFSIEATRKDLKLSEDQQRALRILKDLTRRGLVWIDRRSESEPADRHAESRRRFLRHAEQFLLHGILTEEQARVGKAQIPLFGC